MTPQSQAAADKLTAAGLDLAHFCITNDRELVAALERMGFDDLAVELRGLLSDWRRASNVFRASISVIEEG